MRISDWSSDVCSSDLSRAKSQLRSRPRSPEGRPIGAQCCRPIGRSADWRLSKETALSASPTPRESRRRRALRPAPVVHWRRNLRSSLGFPLSTFLPVRLSSAVHTSELHSLIPLSYSVFFFSLFFF